MPVLGHSGQTDTPIKKIERKQSDYNLLGTALSVFSWPKQFNGPEQGYLQLISEEVVHMDQFVGTNINWWASKTSTHWMQLLVMKELGAWICI